MMSGDERIKVSIAAILTWMALTLNCCRCLRDLSRGCRWDSHLCSRRRGWRRVRRERWAGDELVRPQNA